VCLDDDDDDDGYVGDGDGRGKKLDWMIVPGCCWPSKNELIGLAESFRVQKQAELAQSRVPEEPMYVSRHISQGSEITRGDIETQESWKVAMDSQ
jgi:hypothetical protein